MLAESILMLESVFSLLFMGPYFIWLKFFFLILTHSVFFWLILSENMSGNTIMTGTSTVEPQYLKVKDGKRD